MGERKRDRRQVEVSGANEADIKRESDMHVAINN
jgi:hypothetical protein